MVRFGCRKVSVLWKVKQRLGKLNCIALASAVNFDSPQFNFIDKVCGNVLVSVMLLLRFFEPLIVVAQCSVCLSMKSNLAFFFLSSSDNK